jgi:hypothetical protein
VTAVRQQEMEHVRGHVRPWNPATLACEESIVVLEGYITVVMLLWYLSPYLSIY